MKYIYLLTILFVCSSSHLFAQYRIEAKFKNLRDSVCYLTYYYEDVNYVQDSAKVNANGVVVFQAKQNLEPGLYNLMIGRWKSIDILVVEQHFSFETDAKDIVNSIKFTGSRENDLFYSYQQKIVKEGAKVASLEAKSDSASMNKKYAIQYELEQYRKKFVTAFAGTFASKLIKATMPMDLPQAPKLPNGAEDPLWSNKFFVNHFFDNFDLTDDRMIRTPYIHQNVASYFEPLAYLPIDSLIALSRSVVEKAGRNIAMRKYLITKTTAFFETSKTMGHDAVFVYMMKKYYLQEPQLWDESTIKLVKERVFYLEKLLIGSKIPDVKLTDLAGKEQTLYAQKAPCTILYIYAADCAHCKIFTPQLLQLQRRYADKGLVIFAPIFGNDLDTWGEFIKRYQTYDFVNVIDPTGEISFYQEFDAQYTPTIYILDKEKRVVGKGNLAIEDMEQIVVRYLGK
ncbi:DUF5106 domain-containing protein [Flectobacillus sp. DC10W]|uniref:DUF5106 domain-containing protein n=1 Tax=Flectobacillus longus TaxID=2984207 RepID=A0ABT6YKE1_9BACT|nr:TlpA family protein disulfide reductase [Flectobacillus longus]MDI9864045.1 DUF5106 domain-containing protein [Flectobacillus longus]